MSKVTKEEALRRLNSFDVILDIAQDKYKVLLESGYDPEAAQSLLLTSSVLCASHNLNHIGATINNMGKDIEQDVRLILNIGKLLVERAKEEE